MCFKKGDLLAVYGTLMREGRASLAENPDAIFVMQDEINGQIYSLGGFPGLKGQPGLFDPGQPHVKVDVFQICSDETIRRLDSYEGYPNMYDRYETETALGSHVWVYVYRGEVKEKNLIPNGDWIAFQRERQRKFEAQVLNVEVRSGR